MKIFLALYVSRHFEFEAFAATSEEAITVLKQGLDAHTKQYNLDPKWWVLSDPELDSLEVHEYELGVAYRDREPLRTH